LKSLGTDTAEPARPLIETQPSCTDERQKPFVVRESEVERAQEIADEFYPQNRKLLEEQSGAIIESPGNAELCARICELARLLGYNAAKTRMLVGQWRLDLVDSRGSCNTTSMRDRKFFSRKRGKRLGRQH